MARSAIQRARGTTAQHAPFVGLNGEITVDTDRKTLVVHDGVTPGGNALRPGPLNVKWFGAKGDGIADDTAALLAARDYIAITHESLVFPAGTYRYSASPNWAITNASVYTDGKVTLKYTGTDVAVLIDSGVSGSTFGMKFHGDFVVESNGAASHGVLVRGVHHSSIKLRVAGCGTTSSGVKIESAVCSDFEITVSVNQGFVTGATPANGIIVDRRGGGGDYASACIFYNPIIEGVSGDGIMFQHATQCRVIGGTAEACGQYGVSLTVDSTGNTIDGLDMEVNGAGDVFDAGSRNSYNEIYSDGSIAFIAGGGSRDHRITGGLINSLIDNGFATVLDGTVMRVALGSVTGTAVKQTRFHVQDAETGKYYQDRSWADIGPATVSVPDSTATTILTLPSTGENHYLVSVYLTAAGVSQAASAKVMQVGATSVLYGHTGSGAVTITLSGQNVRVTQTNGATLSYKAFAKSIASDLS